MKPSDLTALLPEYLAMGEPLFVWGKSGIGKSSVIKQYAAAQKLELRDVRLSQLDSIDLKGFPVPNQKNKTMEWLPADFLPTKDDPPGILFLDEMNGAKPAVLSPSYQLILDGAIGSYIFPKHWSIIAAGNTSDARGITHQMPAPLNNRFIHVDFELDSNDWHKQAAADGLSRELRSYLRWKPGSLHVFDSAVNPRSFPTPRAWYKVDKIYKGNYKPLVKLELIRGTVGEGAANEFIGFVRDIASLPDIDQILMHPEKTKLPGSAAVMHAVVTTLVDDKTTVANFDRIMKYVLRLPREIQMVYVRGSSDKDERVTGCPAYMDWAIKNQDILQ
jgi:hypothetical protein